MPSLLRSLPAKALLAVVVTAVPVVIGVARTSPTHPAATAHPLTARLGSVDTTTMAVRRSAFCARLSSATIGAALGARPSSSTTWHPGQSLALNGQVKDVVDEYGCTWTAASGASARAWVFAPPVTPARAAVLATSLPAGCRALPASAGAATTRSPSPSPSPGSGSGSGSASMPVLTYGRPTVALTCGSTTMLRGLFGDAWLSCALSSTDLDLLGRWCLAVARAAG